MIRVTGPIVLDLKFALAADSFLITGPLLDSKAIFPEPTHTGAILSQVLLGGPDFPTNNNQCGFGALLHVARNHIVIVTPAFIPDEPHLPAFQIVVVRGGEAH